MLTISIQLQKDNRQGPGAYKCNPFLAKNKEFCSALVVFLQELEPKIEQRPATHSVQNLWDWIKEEYKEYIKQYQLEDLNWREVCVSFI
ncbi:hypothetical protein MAM1_0005c00630 [Mucor ambiguus]|uniref:Uncharacterized protein n=1 Tax=Mucor ambiguus TaxID=91626 RepID=A0A0C9MGW9_9FUNG|nr:hypothetical protein MAM1_0005c00630 [Mucor ambiguus]